MMDRTDTLEMIAALTRGEKAALDRGMEGLARQFQQAALELAKEDRPEREWPRAS